ncbi:MAG: DUF421 domain-containing protein [Oscillospiraceae bacterium]|nr:DUF421 domain-containing protein [Oscillospiraceae bacterium]
MMIILARTVIMFLLVVAAMRLMGKRQLGQLEPSELVAALIMSELAAMPIVDIGLPILHAVAAVVTIFALQMLMSEVMLKNIKARQVLCGKASLLINDGKIMQPELKRSRMTVDELIEELRLKDITDPGKVQYAMLEANGSLSAILRPEYQPVTAAQMNAATEPSSMPTIIISDGKWLRGNLEKCGLSDDYIDGELRARNVTHVSQVFLLMIDRQHKFYLYLKDENDGSDLK